MEIPYLSKKFFSLIKLTCVEARRRGMWMWLYDEGGWPSGQAGGQVVAENPNFGAWGLRKQNGTFTPIQFLDECRYPDLMNPRATAAFIQLSHERYRAAVGQEFGHTIPGIFTDEPRILGCLGTHIIPWSPLLPAAFRTDHGYPVDTILDLLFEPAANKTTESEFVVARRAYLATLSRLIAENYYRPIRRWCDQHNLLFTGHHSGENHFSRHSQYFGDYLQQAAYYHIPGVDAIWRQIFPDRRHGGYSHGNYVALASSRAWLSGRRLAASENFAVYGAGLTLEQMRGVIGYQLVRGVNQIGYMPSLLNTQGPRHISVCADFSPKNPIWRHIDLLTEYQETIATFTTRGTPCPTVGVFYRTELVRSPAADAFDQAHEKICDAILDQGHTLIFLGLRELASAKVIRKKLCVGKFTLSALVIHIDPPLTPSEQEVIAQIARKGVRVLRVEVKHGSRGRSPSIFWSDAAAVGGRASPRVAQLSPPLRVIPSPLILTRPKNGIRILTLKSGRNYRFLFFNQNSTPTEITFKASSVFLQEADSGDPLVTSLHPLRCSAGKYHLHLHPGQLRAVESISARQHRSPSPRPVRLTKSQLRRTRWELREIERYVIRDDIEIKKVKSNFQPTTLRDYSARHPEFSGTLEYRCRFRHARATSARHILDLGRVYYSASVTLNGADCGRRAWSPFWFDLTPHLVDGENVLIVRVTNTLANQWSAPHVRQRDFKKWRNLYLEKTAPFIDESRHAGLVGPVRLRDFRL